VAAIEQVEISAYVVPTVAPESDGTVEWSTTTMVVAELRCRVETGLGYTYADTGTARIAQDVLAPLVLGTDAHDIPRLFHTMESAVRNHGRGGACAMAISAIEVAAWDLKAKLLGVPLSRLLGRVRDAIPAYGSGGFPSLTVKELEEQLGGWADSGLSFVKMKVGRDPARDPERVRAARKAIGRAELFVDANGAYDVKEALRLAGAFAEQGVSWFEEPVVRTDLAGLRLLRERAPMEVAGGEYGYEPADFRAFLEAPRALDVVQADATRCGGISGFLRAAALIESFDCPMSSHCAPALHAPLACAVRPMRHVEWFSDHSRIEEMLFEGAPRPEDGMLRPQLDRPGLGLSLLRKEAGRYRIPAAKT